MNEHQMREIIRVEVREMMLKDGITVNTIRSKGSDLTIVAEKNIRLNTIESGGAIYMNQAYWTIETGGVLTFHTSGGIQEAPIL